MLQPEPLPFISYPYEWSFGQLKDAALLTLDLQLLALARGFTLRDASAYNVQFRRGRPVFIDTLSFEPHQDGTPWNAYKQFCEHFLLPLSLMSTRDVRCGSMLRDHLDGIPLDLGSALLPRGTWLRPGTLFHIHLHAKALQPLRRLEGERGDEGAHHQPECGGDAGAGSARRGRSLSLAAQRNRVGRLHERQQLHRRRPPPRSGGSCSSSSARRGRPRSGTSAPTPASTAEPRARSPARCVAFDVDPAAVERNYRRVRETGDGGILPLLLDLTNPSPAQGWAHRERLSLEQRGPADLVMALALVHHLAIGHNLPLPKVADFLARLGRRLVIEFVPKSDSQVSGCYRTGRTSFRGTLQEGFEAAFAESFTIDAKQPIMESERTLYLMTAVRR